MRSCEGSKATAARAPHPTGGRRGRDSAPRRGAWAGTKGYVASRQVTSRHMARPLHRPMPRPPRGRTLPVPAYDARSQVWGVRVVKDPLEVLQARVKRRGEAPLKDDVRFTEILRPQAAHVMERDTDD